MSAIAHAYREVSTNFNTASTSYVDVTNAAIDSTWSVTTLNSGTGFVVGAKYLIVVTAEANETGAGFVLLRTLHGSTEFSGSEGRYESTGGSGSNYVAYGFMTVWTAVSGEGIKLQARVTAGDTNVQISTLMAIRLDADLVENTDWFYSESTGLSDSLTTTFSSAVNVSFTPSTASDWLVLQHQRINITSTTVSLQTRINRSGEASSTLPSTTTRYADADPNGCIYSHILPRVFALTAASNTFTEQAGSVTSNAHTRTDARIFALNLNKFDDHQSSYTAGPTVLAASSFGTNLGTTGSIAASPTTNLWIFGYLGFDLNAAVGRELTFRTRVAGTDVPAGQTAGAFQFCEADKDAADIVPYHLSGMVNITAASAVTLDAGDTSAAESAAGVDNMIFGVTMELAQAAAVETVGGGYPSSIFRLRNYRTF